MEESAVEWMTRHLRAQNSPYTKEQIIEIALEMEKEQKKFIFECGRNFQLTGEGTFEEVFNETFRSE